MCNIIKRKPITDKQLLYLYNMVIIPRIEYRTQLTILSKRDCDSIIAPFRQLYKNKIRLSSTAPNAILENNFIYKFRDLYEVQLQSKITNFVIQINDQNLLGKITDIRLKQLQHYEWLSKSPLVTWPYNSIQHNQYRSFIAGMLSLCQQQKIDFHVNNDQHNLILGGNLQREIRTILGEDFSKYKKQLRLNNIMFLEQLSSPNGKFLSTWKTIGRKTFTTSLARTPKWFKELQRYVLEDHNTRRLQQNYFTDSPSHFKGTEITFPNPHNSAKEFVSIWNPLLFKSSLGRIRMKNANNNTCVIEHWVVDEIASITASPVIKLCTGCNIHHSDFSTIETKSTVHNLYCANLYQLSNATVIPNSRPVLDKRELDTPLFELYQLAELHKQFNDRTRNYQFEVQYCLLFMII